MALQQGVLATADEPSAASSCNQKTMEQEETKNERSVASVYSVDPL